MGTKPEQGKATMAGVEVSVYAHATEDEGRVEQAVMNMIPVEAREGGLKVRKLTGHHGGPILLMTTRIRNRKKAEEIFYNIVRSMASIDRLTLSEGAGDRVDERGNLYLRLDKQRAYARGAKLKNVDPIRIKFRFRIPHGSDPAGAVGNYITGVIDEIENGSRVDEEEGL